MRALSILAVVSAPAFAQNNAGGCMVPDVLEIRDLGEGMAVVEYRNSAERCSGGGSKTLTSPAGIAVDVTITVGEGPERIEVIPHDPGFHASPPEADVEDGERIDILIMGGLS